MREPIDQLRPYQQEVARAIYDSVCQQKGFTISVEIARQGGKNELSAHMELLLLTLYGDEVKNLIKCSPTFKPQTVVSMTRLKEKLDRAGYAGQWVSEMGYIIRLGGCRAIFLSAEDSSNVVGNTAHLLLEVDEAQDVSEEKYTKEFKPMGSTTNVTNVLYGTTWDDSTLLEKIKQNNLELERKDGIRRHFRYDWEEVAKYNPDYLAYVQAEKERLGENHPLFLTQYRLLPIRGGGGFLSAAQKAQLQGTHSRRRGPEKIPLNPPFPKGEINKVYVAGIDLAGEAETEEEDYLKALKPRQDSTVMTVGEVEILPMPTPGSSPDRRTNTTNNTNSSIRDAREGDERIPAPFLKDDQGTGFAGMTRKGDPACTASRGSGTNTIKIVEHYYWNGWKHPQLYPHLVDLIRNVWHCRCVVVDATGIGEPVASFLRQALGSRIIPFKFTAQSKTELGFNLLAAINAGGLKMYEADNSPEYREFWQEMERAKSYYRPSRTMNFYVDPTQGHDDFLMSLALLVEAGRQYEPREAKGR